MNCRYNKFRFTLEIRKLKQWIYWRPVCFNVLSKIGSYKKKLLIDIYFRTRRFIDVTWRNAIVLLQQHHCCISSQIRRLFTSQFYYLKISALGVHVEWKFSNIYNILYVRMTEVHFLKPRHTNCITTVSVPLLIIIVFHIPYTSATNFYESDCKTTKNLDNNSWMNSVYFNQAKWCWSQTFIGKIFY